MGNQPYSIAIAGEIADFDSLQSELIDAALWLTFWIVLAGVFGN